MANKLYKLLMIILMAAFGQSVAQAGPLEEAAKAYGGGDYNKAIGIYDSLRREHGTSSELYYDLGQAYTRAGNYGQAMLCYQNAVRLNPYNSKARANIRYIDNKVQDANRAELRDKKLSVVPETQSFFTAVRKYITRRHSSNAWAFWSGVSFVLFCGCVALYIFTRRVLYRKIGFFGGMCLLALCVIFLAFAFMASAAYSRSDEGVITAYKVELRVDPSTSSKTVGTVLTQGTVMSVLETVDNKDGKPDWYKVRLNSDFVGWIKHDSFQLIGI